MTGNISVHATEYVGIILLQNLTIVDLINGWYHFLLHIRVPIGNNLLGNNTRSIILAIDPLGKLPQSITLGKDNPESENPYR